MHGIPHFLFVNSDLPSCLILLPPKAPSDEGAVAIGDWGREIYWDYLFFSPSGTSCHLPHQREARDGANLKQLDKSGFRGLFWGILYGMIGKESQGGALWNFM